MITSVGSLVGQVVLDSLNNRRENLLVVGTNSLAEAANNFRCDKCYLVSQAADTGNFMAELTEIIENEQPELVIPGRDDDVVMLAGLSKKMPEFKDRFLVGTEEFAKTMDDKVLSYRFAQKYGLPFAPTVESGKPDSLSKAKILMEKYGLPFIAKPRKGNGSRGIWVVVEERQLERVALEPGFSIQPFFRKDRDGIEPLDTSFGLPFFWEIKEPGLFAAQAIIKKDRTIEEIFPFVSKMVGGKCERMDVFDDPEMKKIVRSFSEAAVAEGWRGPFNIQLKFDAIHGWHVIEMNGRFSGGTSARYFLGFDEVARIINDWVGEGTIPGRNVPAGNKVVTRILADYPINESNVNKLLYDKVWKRT